VEDGSPSPRRGVSRRAIVVSASVLAAAVAVSTGIVAFAPSSSRRPEPIAMPAAAATQPPPKTPLEQAEQSLDQQAAALLRGDEKGWLAAVDTRRPKLVAHYRSMFRSLRGLGVSQFDYRPYVRPGGKGASIALGATVTYCLSLTSCPRWTADEGSGPRTRQRPLRDHRIDQGARDEPPAAHPLGERRPGLRARQPGHRRRPEVTVQEPPARARHRGEERQDQ
jgi:hypothetical protein